MSCQSAPELDYKNTYWLLQVKDLFCICPHFINKPQSLSQS
ncbi:unnamed protein product [Staurois parvus]|uniref:Uncharacterized protein n=1 Tax=Staurois parvus TaxID=386267 RepID=A0ABN9BE27_9NEOB|nr:unnamed protein product [Staurois parvus]